MSDRDKFEAWASDHFRVHKPNIDYFVPTAWEVWQASRRAALEEAAKICELHSTDYNRRRRTSDNPTYMEGKSDGAEACASALYRSLAEGDKQ